MRLGTGRIRRNMAGTVMFILQSLILDGVRQPNVVSGVMGTLNAFRRGRLTVTLSRSRTFTLVASNSTGEPIRDSRTTVSPGRVVDLWLADGSTGGRSRKDRNLGNRDLDFQSFDNGSCIASDRTLGTVERTFTLSAGSRVVGFRIRFSTLPKLPHISIRLGHDSSRQRGSRATLRAGGVLRLAYFVNYGDNVVSAVDASPGSIVETLAHDGLRGTGTRRCTLSAHDSQRLGLASDVRRVCRNTACDAVRPAPASDR